MEPFNQSSLGRRGVSAGADHSTVGDLREKSASAVAPVQTDRAKLLALGEKLSQGDGAHHARCLSTNIEGLVERFQKFSGIQTHRDPMSSSAGGETLRFARFPVGLHGLRVLEAIVGKRVIGTRPLRTYFSSKPLYRSRSVRACGAKILVTECWRGGTLVDVSCRPRFESEVAQLRFKASWDQSDVVAKTLQSVAEELKKLAPGSSRNTPLAEVRLEGKGGMAAAAALIHACTGEMKDLWKMPRCSSLEDLVAVTFKGSLKTDDRSYNVRGNGLVVQVTQETGGSLSVRVDADLRDLSNEQSSLFSTTETARELRAVFALTGLTERLPSISKLLFETHGEFNPRWGNGYASFSRRLFEMARNPSDSEARALRDYATTQCPELASILGMYRSTVRRESSQQLLSLLESVVSGVGKDRSLPHFAVGKKESGSGSCDDAEGYFVGAALSNNGLFSDDHFIYKTSGAKTALSKTPIVVGGVKVPVGTVCFVEKEGDQIVSVSPLRASMFALDYSESVDVYRHHYHKFRRIHEGDTDDALKRIIQMVRGQRDGPR